MTQKSKAQRFFAGVLVAGGLAGIATGLILGAQIFEQAGLQAVLVFLLIIPFTWATYTGIQLWNGSSFGWKWAPIVYASQIPVFRIPNFLEYEWFTGLNLAPVLKVSGVELQLHFGFNFGANAQFFFGTSAPGFFIGCNLFAVVALALLRRSYTSIQHMDSEPSDG